MPRHQEAAVHWEGLHLSAGDALRAHCYDKQVWPNAPTPLERFALGPVPLLQAQAWAIPETPYLPSTSWWRRVRRLSDRALARIICRISGLVEGRPSVLDRQWREAWRSSLLPGLLDEVRRRRQRARTRVPSAKPSPAPPIDVLETMRGETGEPGVQRGAEWWFHCPFHRDETPSLSVNPEKQVWHCFGCARGGGWKALKEMVA